MRVLPLLIGFLISMASFRGHANGLRLRQELGKGSTIRVWVAWENGWHDTLNQDAVWLFAKEPDVETGGRHLRPQSVTLKQGSDRFQARISSDGVGVWLYARQDYSFEADSALLELYYPQAGSIILRGIEMVLIPQGSFWVGDSLSNKTLAAGTGSSYAITSDQALRLNHINGLYAPPGNDTGLVQLSYPLGYQSFLCQKYEISQGAWADFVQALNPDAAERWYPGLTTGALSQELRYRRSGLVVQNGLLKAAVGPDRAMGGLNWADLTAYLDWAGLRPMTETEFEKACRGPLQPVAKEYAWGTTLAQTPDSMSQDGTSAERPSHVIQPGAGWANFARPVGQLYPAGPVRQGFAASTASDRVGGGFGYWGCAELSGNVWEMCVRIQSQTQFDSTAGDGQLSSEATASQPGWQGVAPIVRGGAHTSLLFNDKNYPFRDLAVSDRFYQEYDCTQRRSTTGGRGVRSW